MTATATRARTFESKNRRTARIAEAACPEGTCKAYKDIFTYFRWDAQGYTPIKGEHGTKLRPAGNDNPKAGVTVFCRHQVTKAE